MIAEALKHMLAAGMEHDAIVAAVADMEASMPKDAQAERRRARDRDRKRLRNSAESAEMTDEVSPKKEIPPTPPKEKTTPSNSPVVGSAREFAEFWSLFPNKVGKRAAEKAFAAARCRADLETILAGLGRYVGKTDDRPWCNPATFLSQDRWADQPAAPPRPHSTASPKPLTQGESLRNMAREKGIIDATGTPIRHLETSNRDGEDSGPGDVIRLAIAGNHGW